YKKFKEVAVMLKEKEYERSQYFSKIPTTNNIHMDELEEQQQEISIDVTLYDMLVALQKLMKRKKIQKPIQTTIQRQEISIEERMDSIMEVLQSSPKRKKFLDLFEENDRGDIVVTFLAILELIKIQKVIVEQENNFQDIFIQRIDQVV